MSQVCCDRYFGLQQPGNVMYMPAQHVEAKCGSPLNQLLNGSLFFHCESTFNGALVKICYIIMLGATSLTVALQSANYFSTFSRFQVCVLHIDTCFCSTLLVSSSLLMRLGLFVYQSQSLEINSQSEIGSNFQRDVS